jgi:4-hydroxyphenylacetate 3-monooxygenase
MAARTGAELIQALKINPLALYHKGALVEDITSEPGIANGVRGLAGLYDHQHEHADLMLIDSPASGDKVGRSFSEPTTLEDISRLGDSMKASSDYSCGMQGRNPAYLNRAMAAFGTASSFLNEHLSGGGDNARNYLDHIRENDLAITHTLINPQANRAEGPAKQRNPFLAARVKKESDSGFVVKGARMLATLPISDEIIVFPSVVLRNPVEEAPYAFAFAIPNSTPGLKFICRESFDYDRNSFDHPLGSRFEELDAVVVFDDVFVPWERVFMYRDVEACNIAYKESTAVVHMAHQVLCKNIAKTEFLLGLVSLMVDSVGIEVFPHVQEKVTEIWVTLETMKAFRRAAEADALLNDHGMMTPAWAPLDAARNLYPRLYPRMIEIIQQLGASGLVAMPTLADLEGPLAEDVIEYYQSARQESRERIGLYRLAWDTALSAFGSRQVLYERFFFGDPVRMAAAAFNSHDREPYMERVREFLRQDD